MLFCCGRDRNTSVLICAVVLLTLHVWWIGRAALVQAEEARALGVCLSAIGCALQQCGGAISHGTTFAGTTIIAAPPAAVSAAAQLDDITLLAGHEI